MTQVGFYLYIVKVTTLTTDFEEKGIMQSKTMMQKSDYAIQENSLIQIKTIIQKNLIMQFMRKKFIKKTKVTN